jgi:hypothetical protein
MTMTMSRIALKAGAVALVLAAISAAQAQERNPIVYNLRGDEVGVIESMRPNGDAIMVPTPMALGLGYYDVVMPAAMLRPRARGGWVTLMSNEAIAFLPPIPPRFFMPSGI